MTVHRPTANSGTFTDAAYAYDQNTSTCAVGSTSPAVLARTMILTTFGSVAVNGVAKITVDWAATLAPAGPTSDEVDAIAYAFISASVDGGLTWTLLGNASRGLWDGASRDRAISTYTMPGLVNLSNLQVRAQSVGSTVTDPETGTKYTATASVSVYEVSVAVNEYSVVLSHTAPGTSAGKTIYASNLWDSATGAYGVASATVPAVFTPDGTNGYWFLESYL